MANQLRKNAISFEMSDNCFLELEDFTRANNLAAGIDPNLIKNRVCHYVSLFVPMIVQTLESSYYLSIKQLELSTDIVFNQKNILSGIYEQLITTAMHVIKAPNVATFLGLNLPYKNIDNIGNNLKKTIEGVRLRHNMGPHSIKKYDKYNKVLRVETTSEKANKFKCRRMVYSRNGERNIKVASVKKNILSLDVLFGIMSSANRRYLDFISALETFKVGRERLKKATSPVKENNRNYTRNKLLQ